MSRTLRKFFRRKTFFFQIAICVLALTATELLFAQSTPTSPDSTTLPAAPIFEEAVGGIRRVTLSWREPADRGTSESITGYVLRIHLGEILHTELTLAATDFTQTITGLVPGVLYTASVATLSAAGEGPAVEQTAVALNLPPAWRVSLFHDRLLSPTLVADHSGSGLNDAGFPVSLSAETPVAGTLTFRLYGGVFSSLNRGGVNIYSLNSQSEMRSAIGRVRSDNVAGLEGGDNLFGFSVAAFGGLGSGNDLSGPGFFAGSPSINLFPHSRAGEVNAIFLSGTAVEKVRQVAQGSRPNARAGLAVAYDNSARELTAQSQFLGLAYGVPGINEVVLAHSNANGSFANMIRIEPDDLQRAGLEQVNEYGGSLAWLGAKRRDDSGFDRLLAVGSRLSATVYIHFVDADQQTDLLSNDDEDAVLAGTVRITPPSAVGTSYGNAISAVGDLDGDGIPDVAVAETSYTGAGASNAGRIFIHLLNPDGTVKDTRVVGHDDLGLAAANGDRLGRAMSSVDFGNGRRNLFVGLNNRAYALAYDEGAEASPETFGLVYEEIVSSSVSEDNAHPGYLLSQIIPADAGIDIQTEGDESAVVQSVAIVGADSAGVLGRWQGRAPGGEWFDIDAESVGEDSAVLLSAASSVRFVVNSAGTVLTSAQLPSLTVRLWDESGLFSAGETGVDASAMVRGNSLFSAQTRVIRLIIPPGAPSSLEVETVAAEGFTARWQPPSDDGGASDGIVAYRVYWENTVTGVENSQESDAVTLTVRGLTDNITYAVSVEAINRDGDTRLTGARTAAVRVTLPQAPQVPGNVQTSVTTQLLTVTWDASAGAVAATQYRVTWTNIADGNSNSRVVAVPLTRLELTVSGGDLTPGARYTVTVLASNSEGLASLPVEATPATIRIPTVPGPPAAPTLAASARQLAITWQTPEDDGGVAVESYIVYWVTDSGASEFSRTVSASPLSLTLRTDAASDNLEDGASYEVSVAAVNGSGEGERSVAASATLPEAIRSAPTITDIAQSTSRLTVFWQAPNDGGALISGYTLYYIATAGGMEMATTVTADVRFAVISGLASETAYRVSVAATNSVGEGPRASQDAMTSSSQPDAPTAVQIPDAALAPTAFTVTWTPPSDTGSVSATLAGYRVIVTETGDLTNLIVVNNVEATSYRATGLDKGTAYEVIVTALNSEGGESVPSQAVPVTTLTTPPDAPSTLSVTVGVDQLEVDWAALDAADGNVTGGAGLGIDAYIVYWAPTATPEDEFSLALSFADAQADTSLTLTVADNQVGRGVAYTVSVAARNTALVIGSRSSPVMTLTPLPDVPTTPTNLVFIAGSDQLEVDWDDSDGRGNAVLDYTVLWSPANTAGETRATVAVSNYTIESLAAETTHMVSVTARNLVGKGPAASATVKTAPIAPPIFEEAVGGIRSVTLSWRAPAGSGTSEGITGYVLRIHLGEILHTELTLAPTSFTQTITGLVPGVLYTASVATLNAAGEGPAAEQTVATAPNVPPVWYISLFHDRLLSPTLVVDHSGSGSNDAGFPTALSAETPAAGTFTFRLYGGVSSTDDRGGVNIYSLNSQSEMRAAISRVRSDDVGGLREEGRFGRSIAAFDGLGSGNNLSAPGFFAGAPSRNNPQFRSGAIDTVFLNGTTVKEVVRRQLQADVRAEVGRAVAYDNSARGLTAEPQFLGLAYGIPGINEVVWVHSNADGSFIMDETRIADRDFQRAGLVQAPGYGGSLAWLGAKRRGSSGFDRLLAVGSRASATVYVHFIDADQRGDLRTNDDEDAVLAGTGRITPPQAVGVSYGNAISAVGDLDGDGIPDVAVAEAGYASAGVSKAGRIFIHLLNPDGSVKDTRIVGHDDLGLRRRSGDNLGQAISSVDFGSRRNLFIGLNNRVYAIAYDEGTKAFGIAYEEIVSNPGDDNDHPGYLLSQIIPADAGIDTQTEGDESAVVQSVAIVAADSAGVSGRWQGRVPGGEWFDIDAESVGEDSAVLLSSASSVRFVVNNGGTVSSSEQLPSLTVRLWDESGLFSAGETGVDVSAMLQSNSLFSAQTRVIRLFVPPGAPSSLEAEAVAAEGFTARWQPASDNGGASDGIVAYRVYWENTVTGVENSQEIDAVTLTVRGLTDNITYAVSVAAISGDGVTRLMNARTAAVRVTLPEAPQVPGNVQTAATTQSLTVTWDASAGAVAATQYLVNWTNIADGNSNSRVVAVPLTRLELTVSGGDLIPGARYTVTVLARNSEGLASLPVEATPATIRIPTVPGQPAAPTLAASVGQLAITWQAPEDDGGAAVENYIVYWATDSDASEFSRTVSVSTLSLTLRADAASDNLENGASYEVSVTAVNESGEGERSVAASATLPSVVPTAPTITDIAPSVNSLTVSWQAPADDGGVPISGYTLYYIAAVSGTEMTLTAGAGDRSAVIVGLSPDTAYRLALTATNGVGESLRTPSEEVTTSLSQPAAPTGVEISDTTLGPTAFTVTWTAPSDTGSASAALTGYRVTATAADGPTSISVSNPLTTSYRFTGLDKGTAYEVTVTALNNEGGESVPSQAVSVTTLTTPPDAPSTPSVTVGVDQLEVDWIALDAADGNVTGGAGLGIDAYIVYWAPTATPAAESSFVLSFDDAQADTSLTLRVADNQVARGVVYTVSVAARNTALVIGSRSSPTMTLTPLPGAAPTFEEAVSGIRSVTLSWRAPVDPGNLAGITGYILRVHLGEMLHTELTLAATSLVQTITGLVPGVFYTASVAALSAAGEGQAAEQTVTTTPNVSPAWRVSLFHDRLSLPILVVDHSGSGSDDDGFPTGLSAETPDTETFTFRLYGGVLSSRSVSDRFLLTVGGVNIYSLNSQSEMQSAVGRVRSDDVGGLEGGDLFGFSVAAFDGLGSGNDLSGRGFFAGVSGRSPDLRGGAVDTVFLSGTAVREVVRQDARGRLNDRTGFAVAYDNSARELTTQSQFLGLAYGIPGPGAVVLAHSNANGSFANMIRIEPNDLQRSDLEQVPEYGGSLAWLGAKRRDSSGFDRLLAVGSRQSATVYVHFVDADQQTDLLSNDDEDAVLAGTGRITPPSAVGISYGNTISAVGDLDGDGMPDVAVAETAYNSAGASSAGRIFIHLLNPDGTVKDTRIVGHADLGLVAADFDEFGQAMSSVDFGNGRRNLFVGFNRRVYALAYDEGAEASPEAFGLAYEEIVSSPGEDNDHPGYLLSQIIPADAGIDIQTEGDESAAVQSVAIVAADSAGVLGRWQGRASGGEWFDIDAESVGDDSAVLLSAASSVRFVVDSAGTVLTSAQLPSLTVRLWDESGLFSAGETGVDAGALAQGNSLLSVQTRVIRLFVPPGVPSSLEVTTGAIEEFTARWQPPSDDGGASDGVVAYRVYWENTVTGVESSQETDTVTATVTGLIGGATYAVSVAAINRDGVTRLTGVRTAAVRIRGLETAPQVPGNVQTSATSQTVTVTWDEPAGDVAAAEYLVIWTNIADDSSNSRVVTAPATRLELTVSGDDLTPGASYTVTVLARNSEGLTSVPEPGSAVPIRIPTSPGPPSVPTPSSSPRQLTITWQAPEDDGGAAVASYIVYWVADSDASEFSRAVSASPLSLTLRTDAASDNLEDGASYEVSVAAVNENGEGERSVAASATLPAVVPSAPTITDIAQSTNRLTVFWQAPNDGGVPISEYTLYYIATAGGMEMATTVTADARSAVIVGLTSDTAYRLSVAATNSVGQGPRTSQDAMTSSSQPDAPTAVQIPDATLAPTAFTVAWTPPTDTGSVSATLAGYRVIVTETSDPSNVIVVNNVEATSHRATGLDKGTAYEVTVTAFNSEGGESVPSQAVPVTTLTTPPDAPSTPSVMVGVDQLEVDWTALDAADGNVTGGAGLGIDAYIVYWAPTATPAAESSLVLSFADAEADTSLTLTVADAQVARGIAYTVSVAARNTESAIGSRSLPAMTLTPLPDVPTTPTNLVFIAGSDQLEVDWDDSDDRGSAVLDYTVQWAPANTAGTTRATVAVSNYTIESLAVGTTHTVRVTARNAVGKGQAASATVKTAVIGPPIFEEAVGGIGRVTLSWRRPVDPGNPVGITGYVLRIHLGEMLHTELTLAATSLVQTVTELVPGVFYTASVAALNAAGEGLAAEQTVVALNVPPAWRVSLFHDQLSSPTLVVDHSDSGLNDAGFPTALSAETPDAGTFTFRLYGGASSTSDRGGVNIYSLNSQSGMRAAIGRVRSDDVGGLSDEDRFGFSVAAFDGLGSRNNLSVPGFWAGVPYRNNPQSGSGAINTVFLSGTAVEGIRQGAQGGLNALSGFAVAYDNSARELTAQSQFLGLAYGVPGINEVVLAHSNANGSFANMIRIESHDLQRAGLEQVSEYGGSLAWLGTKRRDDSGLDRLLAVGSRASATVYVHFVDADQQADLLSNDDEDAVLAGTVRITPSSSSPTVGISYGNTISAVGDLDGDGMPDVAVAETAYTNDGVSNGGRIFIHLLNPDGTVKDTRVVGHDDLGLVAASEDELGRAMSSVDFGNGRRSLFVGLANRVYALAYDEGADASPETFGIAYEEIVSSSVSEDNAHPGYLLSQIIPADAGIDIQTEDDESAVVQSVAIVGADSAGVLGRWQGRAPGGEWFDIDAESVGEDSAVLLSAASSLRFVVNSAGTLLTSAQLPSLTVRLWDESSLFSAGETDVDVGAMVQGNSLFSAQTRVIRLFIPPGVPSSLDVEVVAADGFTARWQPPSDDGGASDGVVAYRVYWENTVTGIENSQESDTVTLTVRGLTDNIAYTVSVAAINSDGVTRLMGARTAAVGVTLPQAPQAPGNVQASATAQSLTVTWEASAGTVVATQYRVTWTNIADGNSNSRMVAVPSTRLELTVAGGDLIPGARYTVTVLASNSEGLASAPVEATPATIRIPTVPGQPAALTLAASVGQLAITWQAPEDDGDAVLESYIVYWTPDSGASGFSRTVSAPTLSLTLRTDAASDNLEDGASYGVSVAAVNENGEGERSVAASATLPGVPAAPTITDIVPDTTRLTVSWQAPADDGGDPISEYTLYYMAIVSGTEMTTTATADARSAVITGLTSNTAYRVAVAATNGVGESPRASQDATTSPVRPGAPTGVDVSVATIASTAFTVTWTPPTDTGSASATLTGYRVTAAAADGPTSMSVNNPLATSHRFTNLDKGTAYEVTVTALNNEGGESVPSQAVSVTTLTTPPDAPSTPSATVGVDQLEVDWTALDTADGNVTGGAGLGIDAYIVYWAPTATPAAESSLVLSFSDAEADTSLTLTVADAQVARGTAYTVSVAARNTESAIGSRSPMTMTVLPDVPTTPQNLVFTAGRDELAVDWDDSDDRGSAVLDYTVQWSPANTAGTTRATVAVSNYTIESLALNTAYTVSVTARNAVGVSAPATAVETTLDIAPLAPSNLVLIRGLAIAGTPEVGITVSWDAPEGSGGGSIASYEVYWAAEGEVLVSPAGPEVSDTSAPDYTYNITGLSKGTTYTVTVAAVNNAAETRAEEQTTVTHVTAPSPPRNLSSITSDQAIDLRWDAPIDNGGLPPVTYTLRWSTGTSIAQDDVTVETLIEDTNFTITGLQNGTEYTVEVIAVNSFGESEPTRALTISAGSIPLLRLRLRVFLEGALQ